jgi:phosphoglycolate phosphatase-like HAD superfamily hydrolase
MKVVFDLDGTLADNQARQHLARKAAVVDDGDKEAAWDEFHKGIPDDPPIKAVRITLWALHYAGHEIEIWTARPERYRALTVAWLREHHIHFDHLKMRKDDEGRVPAAEIKTRWYAQEWYKPDLIFEDNAKVVAAFRKLGVIVAQVGEEPQ